jgi:hypothetical protein
MTRGEGKDHDGGHEFVHEKGVLKKKTKTKSRKKNGKEEQILCLKLIKTPTLPPTPQCFNFINVQHS